MIPSFTSNAVEPRFASRMRTRPIPVPATDLRSISDLRDYYQSIKTVVESRLDEFQTVRFKGNQRVFEELIFSILCAGTSALMAQRAVESVTSLIWDAPLKRLTKALKSYRFPRQRALSLFLARETVKRIGGDLIGWLGGFENPFAMREACIRYFHGLGYKTASHFLRNIGHFGCAILDVHVARCLHTLAILPSPQPPSSRKGYLKAEERFLSFAQEIGIYPEALDLVLWASRTGYVFK